MSRHRADTAPTPGRHRADTAPTPGRHRADTAPTPGRHRAPPAAPFSSPLEPEPSRSRAGAEPEPSRSRAGAEPEPSRSRVGAGREWKTLYRRDRDGIRRSRSTSPSGFPASPQPSSCLCHRYRGSPLDQTIGISAVAQSAVFTDWWLTLIGPLRYRQRPCGTFLHRKRHITLRRSFTGKPAGLASHKALSVLHHCARHQRCAPLFRRRNGAAAPGGGGVSRARHQRSNQAASSSAASTSAPSLPQQPLPVLRRRRHCGRLLVRWA